MSRVFGVALAFTGVGLAILAWSPGQFERTASEQLASVVRITTEGKDLPHGIRTEPAKSVPTTTERGRAVPDSDNTRAVTSGTAQAATSELGRITSVRPGDEASRRTLALNIQMELKRVGCFDGDVDGAWSAQTKRAMQMFVERVNATLPVAEPDYILLTLLQGQHAQVCGKGCPSGQVATDQSRCEPRAIIARQSEQKLQRQQEAEAKRSKQEQSQGDVVGAPGAEADRATRRPVAIAAAVAPLPGPPPSRLGAPVEPASPRDGTDVAPPSAAPAPAGPVQAALQPARPEPPHARKAPTPKPARAAARSVQPAPVSRPAPQRAATRQPGPALRTSLFAQLARDAP